MPEEWSYAVVRLLNIQATSIESRLNALGADGWELVSALPMNKAFMAIGNEMVFILKKPGAGHRVADADPQFGGNVPY